MTPHIIAHRGHWRRDPARQNHPEAVLEARARGWGSEIDLHWDAGRAWIGHDTMSPRSPLDRWLADVGPCDVPVLLNIKSTHLDVQLRMLAAQIPDLWIFDHELHDPDLPRRYPTGRYLSRCTDLATFAALDTYDRHPGVWLDQPSGTWVTGTTVEACVLSGRTPFLVSPELHGRPIDLAQWRAVWAAGGSICTDLPGLADAVLHAKAEVVPDAPWWDVHE